MHDSPFHEPLVLFSHLAGVTTRLEFVPSVLVLPQRSTPLVTFRGRWHTLDRVAITPRPPRALPIWIGGGTSEHVLRRVARLADGWMPLLQPTEDLENAMARLRALLAEAGRDPAAFGLDVRIRGTGGPADWAGPGAGAGSARRISVLAPGAASRPRSSWSSRFG